MPKKTLEKDLFGHPVKHRRPRYEAALERVERASRPRRAARVRWLEKAIPEDCGYLMAVESLYVFEEAKSSFIYGHFVATIVLAASFVEHWLVSQLNTKGFHKEASRGLAACIKCARENRLVTKGLLNRVDRLRLIRNPFVHLKSFDHEHGLVQRSLRHQAHPEEILETDARNALAAMYEISVFAFGRL